MNIQKVKDKKWLDETGNLVPVEYISPGNRLKERHAGTLATEAKRLNKTLVEYKQNVDKLCKEVHVKMCEELKSNPDTKGNYTWFNFDRSIKVEVSVSERIDFDDLTIKASKEKLDEFLNQSLDAKQEFVKELVTEAFSTSRGKLDAKKVMSLLKWRVRIVNPLFQEALNLLEASIRRPDSKVYFRISEKLDNNEYQIIDLNFSSI